MSDSWHEKVKNKNREDILKAAKQLFLKYNFANVNIKDVCELAGISRVTFYKHFKSIDELIFQVQMDILSNMEQLLRSADSLEHTGKERIEHILYAWLAFARNHREEMKFIIFFDLYYEAYASNEELKLNYEKFINRNGRKDFLEAALSKGIEDGSLKKDLNTTKTGYYIFQVVMGVLQRMVYTILPISEEELTFDDIAASVINMIIKAISED